MANETEIKLRVEDVELFRRELGRLGARLVRRGSGRVHESNMLFDTAEEDLRRRGELLRIRRETQVGSNSKHVGTAVERVLVTLKRPVRSGPDVGKIGSRPRRHKIREEIELEVTDAPLMTRIFEALGMSGWFRYEKFRTTYRLPESRRWAKGLLIELDETPIGTFVELEGPPGAIDRAAKELGFGKRDYIVMNYLTLYRAECRRRGKEPGNMVFQERNKRRERLRQKNLR
jgi:adenylate cyclase, class 2